MRVAVYARVSTSDRDQNPETQLIPLREFCHAQGWDNAGEYVDQASASDQRGRIAWRKLLDDAAKRKIDLVLVWRMDRASRSVLDAANTLAQFRTWGVGLRSYQEPWLDTTSPFGEALYYITVAYAQLERGILSERVKAGMERAKRQGKGIGRPTVFARNPSLEKHWTGIASEVVAGRLTIRATARLLKVSPATVMRLKELFQNGGGKSRYGNAD